MKAGRRLAWLLILGVIQGIFPLAPQPCTAAGRGGDEPPRAAEQEPDDQDLWVFRQSVALGVPEGELTALIDKCREQGFTTAEVQRLLALIAKAKLAGLPHDDLLRKLREGLAKNAGPEVVDAALQAKAQTLRRAKTVVDTLLLDEWSAPSYELAVKITADALDYGASVQTILSVVREGSPRPDGMPDVASAFRRVVRARK
jgi:hypothetical protein